jgi:N12 class adenine-specific DNA methylase
MVPPGVKVPKFTELRGVVHALSEYTAKFADVDTVPAEAKVVDVVIAEKVVSAKASPIMTNAAAAIVIESFS